MAQRTIICLRCPRGCDITATLDRDGRVEKTEGNFCKLGIEYATQEVSDPRRILPTTVRVRGGTDPLVPVWTPVPLPRAHLLDLARATRSIVVDAPVEIGQVIIHDWGGTGVDLVASGEVAVGSLA